MTQQPQQQPIASLIAPDGEAVEVGPGGVIGRLASAALCIDDPRISEAHAMVSLRGGQLVLLALRGGLRIGHRRVSRLRLEAGQRIELVDGLAVQVEAVQLPAEVLGLRLGEAAEAQPLLSSVYSVQGGELLPGYAPGASAHLWAAAEGWRLRLRGEDSPHPLEPGSVHETDEGTRLQAERVSAGVASMDATVSTAVAPVQLVARFETVHVHAGDASVRVPGIPARAICELIDYQVPVPWEMVARTIWTDVRDRYVLRQNWDRHLRSLRKRLRDAGLRDDLIRPDGRGNVELYLLPEDEVIDQR